MINQTGPWGIRHLATLHRSSNACKCLGCMVVGMLLQGREADVVIFSCVRANAEGSLGHTSDTCRMNVGLTRAKYAHKSAHQ